MADLDSLYASNPALRLSAARALGGRSSRKLLDGIGAWPPLSPGAANAWLLLVTTKSPTWRDPLFPWPEGTLTLGEPHDGFLYPDPIGFWSEVRRWSIELFRAHQPTWSTGECLALTSLVHVGDDPGQMARATRTCQPRMTVFLDEPAWDAAGLTVATTPVSVPDPYREGQTYVGWWGVQADGTVVGKSPQHPTMHRLYRAEDLTAWLQSAPRPT